MSAVIKALPIVTVTTSGTAVAVSATNIENVLEVYISCPATNTGNIMFGDSSVEAASGLSGAEIAKGTTLKIGYCGQYIDLKNLYIDALNNGDKAKISYLIMV